MPKHLVIVGAGPGVSLVTAKLFGGEGYAVTLLGRTKEKLQALAVTLGEDGVDASIQVADVTDFDGLRATLREIDAATPIDVLIYQPGAVHLVDVLEATVENVRPNLDLQILGAVATGEVLIPAMRARGTGTLIFIGGGSSRLALPFFGNLGQAMSGMRNYALTLNKKLRDTDVFVGFLTVAGHMATADGEVKDGMMDPRNVTERLWKMVADRGPNETLMTAEGEIPVKGAK
ncbi:MAG: short-chain dehydrogenase/reductase [Nocardioidaceae bacterium]|nr:short-chain dehydrogenase/reductase [Nocardioidaceae bacterium]